jgi:hypothetical protein
LASWFIWLTEVPPYQDLPNHLASMHIADHPARYAEDFVNNGLLKTNSALFAFLLFFGRFFGLFFAAKVFAALTVGLTSLGLARLFYVLGGRRLLLHASLFSWPLAHQWFLSAGMLDYALGVAIGLLLLAEFVELERMLERAEKPPLQRLGACVGLALLLWYAHAFALLIVGFLFVVESSVLLMRSVALGRAFLARGALVLAPASMLTAHSVYTHLAEKKGAMTAGMDLRLDHSPDTLAYNLFAEGIYGFSPYSFACVFAFVAALTVLVRRRIDAAVALEVKEPSGPSVTGNVPAERPMFRAPALVLTFALYCLLPYAATNWFHINTRFVFFLWLFVLVRVPLAFPSRLGRWLGRAACLFVCMYSAGMAGDYLRLERDRKEFVAGVPWVQRGDRLLPLIMSPKGSSDNTRNVLHMWGYYVLAKDTSAPLLFAHSAGFPVMYRTPPKPRLNHLFLEGFVATLRTPEVYCKTLREKAIVTDCAAEFDARWQTFWRDAENETDAILLWDAGPDVVKNLPSGFSRVFVQGRLEIWRKRLPE